jgi:general secretion pathway protein A
MYAPFFGLSKEPFSIAPDPRFLFMSEQHREALAHLMYGLAGGGGFVLLTGEIGAGKTTVCRCFLEQVPASCAVAYIFNPKLTAHELLQTVCAEFGIHPPAHSGNEPGSLKAHVDALNAFLLTAHAQGRQAVLVIDEAQSLAPDVLEQLRLLTNLETAERKLLQIILIGQPELRDLLARPELEQLSQRVTARFHLGALSFEETKQYLAHRLAVAGLRAGLPFNAAAVASIFSLSGGVPRRINLLADRALLGAYSQGQMQADKNTVAQAGREVFAQRVGSNKNDGDNGWQAPGPGAASKLAVLAAVALAAGAGGWFWSQKMGASQPVVPLAAVLKESSTAAKPVPGPSGAVATAASASALPSSASLGAASAAPLVAGAAGTASATAAASPAASASASSSSPMPGNDPAALLLAAQPLQATAWRELALRWNVAIGEGDPCVAALQAQLACFRSTGGALPLLRLLARPGVLTLHMLSAEAALSASSAAKTKTARVRYAVLVALDDSKATLQVGRQRFDLSLPALAQIWRGEFATLWRTPTGWQATADTAAGALPAPTRAWVDQQLARAGFDNSRPLRERLRAYQLTQGLPPDGLAGPLTLMMLSRDAGVMEPRLGQADR